jgi:hypothetical protein
MEYRRIARCALGHIVSSICPFDNSPAGGQIFNLLTSLHYVSSEAERAGFVDLFDRFLG